MAVRLLQFLIRDGKQFNVTFSYILYFYLGCYQSYLLSYTGYPLLKH